MHSSQTSLVLSKLNYVHLLPHAKHRFTLSLTPVRAPPIVWRAPPIHPRWVSSIVWVHFSLTTSPHLTSDPTSILVRRPHLTPDPPSIWVRRPHLTSDPHTSDPPSTKANPHPFKPINNPNATLTISDLIYIYILFIYLYIKLFI